MKGTLSQGVIHIVKDATAFSHLDKRAVEEKVDGAAERTKAKLNV